MLKAFKFRMYPTEEQKQQLIRTFGCVRFTYNHLLKERQKSWQQTGVVAIISRDVQLPKA